MKILYCFAILVLANSVFGWAGEYIPRSYYVIDHNGHQSDVVYFRSKRDIEQFPIFRVRRSSTSASAHASASASSGSGDFYGDDDFVPSFDNLPNILGRLGANIGGPGGPGGQAYSSSSSSGNGYGSGTGYSSGGNGGSGGYKGPILFSRFGETEGTGVHVSGSAQGPHGAFSSTSSSSKDGKVSYSVQSGKY